MTEDGEYGVQHLATRRCGVMRLGSEATVICYWSKLGLLVDSLSTRPNGSTCIALMVGRHDDLIDVQPANRDLVMGDLAFNKSFDMLRTGEEHWAIKLLNEGMEPLSLNCKLSYWKRRCFANPCHSPTMVLPHFDRHSRPCSRLLEVHRVLLPETRRAIRRKDG